MKTTQVKSPLAATVRTAGLLLLLLTALPALAGNSNKWRMEFSGKAKVDGEIELSFKPKDGEAMQLVIAVPRRTSENRAAALVRDSIRAKFGKDVYHTEVDDGEDVLVKTRGSTPNFELTVLRNTATGLRLNLDQE
jgi:uncharacterized protein (DUF58 family)